MKNLITLIAILFSIITIGQEFSGKAVYKTVSKSNFDFTNKEYQDLSDDLKKQAQELLEKQFQKTYILSFNKYTSSYEQQSNQNDSQPNFASKNANIGTFNSSNNSDVFYKSLKENRYSKKTDILNKDFLIKDELPKYEWRLTNEKKFIGKYECYKAIYNREIKSKAISLSGSDKKEQTIVKNIEVTAWYTTEIPISNGPDKYHGLPGLILEINDGTNTTVCTEIVLNQDENIKITEPEKGKVVSQKEFDNIRVEKAKEMIKKGNGGNFIIKKRG